MPPIPPIFFATPQIDFQTGNGIKGLVIDDGRWEVDRILKCSVIFSRESSFDPNTGTLDVESTAILLANNSLHYQRTVDIEHFFVAYDDAGVIPIGIGFGSLGSPQSWNTGNGQRIEIPAIIPIIGGRRIVTFKDDMPLTWAIDPRVTAHKGLNILPWDAFEAPAPGGAGRRLYVSTPNHMFDWVNRNAGMVHVDQQYLSGSFQQLVRLPSAEFASFEDVARRYPDESNTNVRDAVRFAATTLFGRPWLF